jgi:hypothetical protein
VAVAVVVVELRHQTLLLTEAAVAVVLVTELLDSPVEVRFAALSTLLLEQLAH